MEYVVEGYLLSVSKSSAAVLKNPLSLHYFALSRYTALGWMGVSIRIPSVFKVLLFYGLVYEEGDWCVLAHGFTIPVFMICFTKRVVGVCWHMGSLYQGLKCL